MKLEEELLEMLAVIYYAAKVEPVTLGTLVKIFVAQGVDDADIMALGRYGTRLANDTHATESETTEGPGVLGGGDGALECSRENQARPIRHHRHPSR